MCDHKLTIRCGEHGYGCAYADIDSKTKLPREFRNRPAGTGCTIKIVRFGTEENVALSITTESTTSAVGITANAGLSFDRESGASPGVGIEGTLEKSVSRSSPIVVRRRFSAW